MELPSTTFLLDRIRGGNGLDWKDGKFFLLGMKAHISAAFSNVFLQKLLEEKVGYQKTQDLYYSHGKFQAREGVRIFNKRFGYAKSFSEISNLLDIHLGQFQLTGTGQFSWVVKDIKKKESVVKGISPLAEEYSLYFNCKDRPVDHFVRGLMSGLFSEVFDADFYCLETSCIAHGKSNCTFTIKEKNKFDISTEEYKMQKINEEIDLLEVLKPKKDPLL